MFDVKKGGPLTPLKLLALANAMDVLDRFVPHVGTDVQQDLRRWAAELAAGQLITGRLLGVHEDEDEDDDYCAEDVEDDPDG